MPFNINTDESVIYAAKLAKLNRSALPVSVRQTLNRAALDVKRVTMPAETDKDFKKRKRTFWMATSTVDMATGFDVNQMRSMVGFVAPGNIKESGHATQDLEQQEYGGDIAKRAFIATDRGRTGAGNVKDANTMAKIKSHIYDSEIEQGKNESERFIKAAVKHGYPSFILGSKGERTTRGLMRIISVHRVKAGDPGAVQRGKYLGEARSNIIGNTVVKSEEIYDVQGHREAHVKATHFMEKSAEVTTKKMPAMFAEMAEVQFAKVLKK